MTKTTDTISAELLTALKECTDAYYANYGKWDDIEEQKLRVLREAAHRYEAAIGQIARGTLEVR